MSDCEEAPRDHEISSNDHQDAPNGQQNGPSDQQDTPSDHQDGPSDHQDAPTPPNGTGSVAIQQRIDDVTDRSLAATERIAQVATETRELGEETSTMLVHQGEQLSGIKRRTEDIHDDLEEAEENISKLECCTCGLFRRRRRGGRRKKGTKPRLEFHEHPPPEPATVKSSRSEAEGHPPGEAASAGPFVKRITGDEREVKMEENLRYTSDQVTVLGKMAEEQSRELDRHLELIEDAHTNIENDNTQLEKDIKRLRKLE